MLPARCCDAVLPLLNTFARVPICGTIAQYNDTAPPPGPDKLPALWRMILTKRLTVRGLLVTDFARIAWRLPARHVGMGARGAREISRGYRRRFRECAARADRTPARREFRQTFGACRGTERNQMSVQMILLPLFVQVLLTIALGLHLAVRRRVARSRRVRAGRTSRCASRTGRRTAIIANNAFYQPVRDAGAVLCADDPRADHQAGRSAFRDDGVDLRRDARFCRPACSSPATMCRPAAPSSASA